MLQAGGLRPAGPPCTLARGAPTIPAPLAWLSRCLSFAPHVGLGLQLLEDLLDAVVLGDRGVVEELELRHAPQAHPLPDLAPQERRRPCEGLAGLALRLRVAVGRVVDARDLQIGGYLDLRQGQEADAGIVHLARDELRQLDADLLADLFGPVACHGVSSSQFTVHRKRHLRCLQLHTAYRKLQTYAVAATRSTTKASMTSPTLMSLYFSKPMQNS